MARKESIADRHDRLAAAYACQDQGWRFADSILAALGPAAPVSFAETSPEVLHEAPARYPARARELGVEGTVVLRIEVEEDGSVGWAVVSSGPGYDLDEAAQAAILRFRFKPASLGGRPVATTMLYQFKFQLD
jgi:protein TonB